MNVEVQGQARRTAGGTPARKLCYSSRGISWEFIIGPNAFQIMAAGTLINGYNYFYGNWHLVFQNVSAAGQNMRLGYDNTVSFVPARGILLPPLDVGGGVLSNALSRLVLPDWNGDLWVIADAIGGLLSINSMITTDRQDLGALG